MNVVRNLSPKITSHSWGQIIVEGYPPFKDVKLFPGGARTWDWNETGTCHSPGIQPADVQELIDNGARIIILSEGMVGRLGIQSETLIKLKELGIEVYVHRTKKAVRLYNKFRVDQPVGALIHSTC